MFADVAAVADEGNDEESEETGKYQEHDAKDYYHASGRSRDYSGEHELCIVFSRTHRRAPH